VVIGRRSHRRGVVAALKWPAEFSLEKYPMRPRWRWILVIATATAVDLLIRFAGPFDFRRVMLREAVLFTATGLVLAGLLRFEPMKRGWPRTTRVLLVWFFLLGGLRPILYSLGVPLMAANLTTLIVALGGLAVWLLRRRRQRPAQPPTETPPDTA